jgi:hypothetical protein
MLPAELWKHIALQYTIDNYPSPGVYVILSLVSRMFIMPTPQLQEYYLRTYMENGKTVYKLTPSNRLHSPLYGDLPAVVHANGTQYWYINGKQHRDEDLPAVVCANGARYWYVNGKQHRDGDLPAAVYATGDQAWYVNDELHRDGDLPAIIRANGDQYWYINGKRHRDGDLPAIVCTNGDQYWYINGHWIR